MSAHWKRIGIIAGALVSVIALVSAASPVLRSDAPPWSGIVRVEKSSDHLEALMRQGQIRGTWRDYCNAFRSGNADLADTYSLALGDLQVEYQRLTGAPFPLRAC